jgi:hypothetical protein
VKKFIAAVVQNALWYETEFYSDRVAFAGGVMAGTLIPLAIGLIGVGYGYGQSFTAVVFSAIAFVGVVFCASGALLIGRKYGDKEPLNKILEDMKKD